VQTLEIGSIRAFALRMIVISAALAASTAFAEEVAPAAKESSPAAKGSAPSIPAAHPSGREPLSIRDGASRPGGSAPHKGAPLNAGSAPAATPKESATGANPIDTRMNVETPRAPKKPLAGTEKKPAVPAIAPAINASRHTVPREMPSLAPRNAIGVPIEDHARAKGPPLSPPAGAPAAVTGRSAIAIPTPTASPGALTAHPSSMSGMRMPPQRTGITGTGMSRPGSGPRTLGGVAKSSGGIDGTTIRAKP